MRCQVDKLLQFNQGLLEKVRARVSNWDDRTQIGDIFVAASNDLALYTHYVNNYNKGPFTA